MAHTDTPTSAARAAATTLTVTVPALRPLRRGYRPPALRAPPLAAAPCHSVPRCLRKRRGRGSVSRGVSVLRGLGAVLESRRCGFEACPGARSCSLPASPRRSPAASERGLAVIAFLLALDVFLRKICVGFRGSAPPTGAASGHRWWPVTEEQPRLGLTPPKQLLHSHQHCSAALGTNPLDSLCSTPK